MINLIPQLCDHLKNWQAKNTRALSRSFVRWFSGKKKLNGFVHYFLVIQTYLNGLRY